MNNIHSGRAFSLLLPIFFAAASAWPQTEGAGRLELKKILEDRGFPVEEGLLFSGPGEWSGLEEPGAALEPSLLLRFSAPAGPDAKVPETGEAPEGIRPLMVAAFPLSAPEGPESSLPYPFRIAMVLAEQARTRQAAGQALAGDLLIAFLGEDDVRQYEDPGGRTAGELTAYGGMIGEPENTFFWYFDLPGPSQSLLIHHGTSRTIAALDVLQGLPELFQTLDIPYGFAVPFNEMYKLGLAGGPEILRFTQGQDIRALYFSGRSAGEAAAAARVSEDQLAELILSYAASLKNPGANPDYHYLIIPLWNGHLFLSQERTALLLLFFAAFFFLSLLMYIGFYRPPMARIRIFFRCFWVIPGFFLVLFVSLEGAGLITGLLSRGRTYSIALIYGWSAWKLILGLSFFALLSIPLGNYRISRRAAFYGSGAILLIILDLFAAAWADLCFIPFFIAAFLLIFLGAQIKRPVPVYFCAVLAPFYGFIAGFFSLRSSYGGLGEMLLSNHPLPATFMILAFLPFVLLFKRGISLGRLKTPDLGHRLLPFFILLGCNLILGLVLLIGSSKGFIA